MAIKKKTVIIVAVIIAFLGIIGVGSGYTVYLRVMAPNVAVQEDVSLYVKPTFNLDSILVQTQKLQLVNLLMSGRQTPVNVTFNNIRTKADFAGRIGEQLIADSSDFVAYFDSSAYFSTLGLNKDNFMTIFIPNTYE